MSYSVKWVEDNLGVTRKALRYYEKERLLPREGSRNPVNNYREYSEDDISRIWSIKILIGIGYTAKEIFALMNNPDFDFYSSISEKVQELEKKLDQDTQYLQFAKTIKLTGRIPTVNRIGSIQYDDFIQYARENWNFYDDPQIAPCLEMAEKLADKKPEEWTLEDLSELQLERLESFMDMQTTYLKGAYYKLISELQFMDYNSETVQTVVKLLYEHFADSDLVVDKQVFARYQASHFLDGTLAVINERNYGKSGCLFIAKAIAYFGGYESIDDI